MKPLRVLLVERHPMQGPLLSETLARMGHEVFPLAGGHAGALEAAVRLQADLLVVDMALSDARAHAAMENGHAAPPIRHVFISAHACRADPFKPGAVALKMPFDGAHLARAIDQVVAASPP